MVKFMRIKRPCVVHLNMAEVKRKNRPELVVPDEDVGAKEKLTSLNLALQSAGIGTWIFDFAGNKRYFDDTSSRMLGFDAVRCNRTHKEFLNRIHTDDRARVGKIFLNLEKKPTDIDVDFKVVRENETVRSLNAKAKVITNDNGSPVSVIGLLLDITDQKRLEFALQENICKTASIFDNFGGAIFRCKFDSEMTMEYLSIGVKDLTGYPCSDFLMNKVRSFSSITYGNDKEKVIRNIRDTLSESNSFEVEYRILSAQNEIKWIWGRGKGVYDGENIVALEGFLSDITERKQIEHELKSSLKQLHQVAHHIEEVREKERLSISRELHDDLGQALTAVKIDLTAIKQNVNDMATVLLINRASALVSDTIKKVQSLTSQLRPQIIDDLGLETAIEWYTKEFEQRSRIAIILDLNCDAKISSDDSLIIFRIMQEALTNVARYSGANTVRIMLGKKGRNIIFSISDNGIGITEDKMNSSKSFGIIGMKERAASLGGTLKIYRDDNRYTVVSLIIPLKKVTDENSDL